MKLALIGSLLFLLLLTSASSTNSNLDVRQILEHVLAILKANEEKSQNVGYFQDTLIQELEEDGTVSDQKKRTYRIVWIEGEQYAELIQENNLPLTPKLKAEEQKRREKFIKSMKKKDDDEDEDEDDLSWEDLFEKYDFRLVDSAGFYVISFAPKAGKLKERSRPEKIYNHLSGKLWIGPDYSLQKATATLTKNVRFGLGILGNVQDLELSYSQKRFENVWIPDQLIVSFKARVFLSSKNQRLSIRFYDPYKRAS